MNNQTTTRSIQLHSGVRSAEVANQDPRTSGSRESEGERGDVMLMTMAMLGFLMLTFWAMASASQQWHTNRDVHAVAAAAARAGAQGDPVTFRTGIAIDPAEAASQAQTVIRAAGYVGTVTTDGFTVQVTVTGTVDYTFPSPGFATQISGHAEAELVRGVTGNEGG